MPPAPEAPGHLSRAARSFTAKFILLALVFITVPLILYAQLRNADIRKSEMLHDAIVQHDRLIVEVLQPYIERFGQDQPQNLQETLDRLAENGTNIKLLYQPKNVAPAGIFYIASAPVLSQGDLERERRVLLDLGIFNQIEDTCRDMPILDSYFTSPIDENQVLTSLTSLATGSGCWAIITARSGQAFMQMATEKPLWQAAPMQVAIIIYALSAGLVVWLFADLWHNIALFRTAARKIRFRGMTGVSFREANRIPELSGVAEDFDALVSALVESQSMMKRAAEENSHALKTLLGIISQSLEPLKRAIQGENPGIQRNVELIEHSIERLDGLVSAVRDLDVASADAVYPRRWRMNLSQFVERLLAAYAGTLVPEDKKLSMTIEPNIFVLASEDILEPIIENLLDNARSFSPAGGTISVSLSFAQGRASLSFADEGPGVEPQYLDRIFDRYFSWRPQNPMRGRGQGAFAADHFGLGLWIVKRNIEGVGGTVRAERRSPRGLVVTVELPAID